MANIVVKDLTENVELDRKAMRKISGGKALSKVNVAQIAILAVSDVAPRVYGIC